MSPTDQPAAEHGKPQHEFHIQIDRTHFTVTEEALTGAQLRNLPQPPVTAERELYQIRPGETDLPIADADSVKMHDGLRFFTAPRQINPGA
jgi:hypothetical protein